MVAEFSFKRRGEYLRGIFKILYNENDGLKAKDVLSRLENEVKPTPLHTAILSVSREPESRSRLRKGQTGSVSMEYAQLLQYYLMKMSVYL